LDVHFITPVEFQTGDIEIVVNMLQFTGQVDLDHIAVANHVPHQPRHLYNRLTGFLVFVSLGDGIDVVQDSQCIDNQINRKNREIIGFPAGKPYHLVRDFIGSGREIEEAQEDLIELEAANAIRKMLEEIAKRKDISDLEKAKEFERILREANKMKSENIKRMLGIEKFEFELHKLLKSEGLLPEGEAEFVLKWNECSIDGKKLPKEIHSKILRLCEESLGKEFKRDTKIVLFLNEER
jgi:hypothetical protein